MVRRVFFWAHLALGVVGGIVILVLCLTGALLTYQKQIVGWVDRDLRRVEAPAAAPVSLERLVEATQRERPGPPATAVTVYADPAEAAVVALGRAGLVYVEPATGKVRGEGSRGVRALFRTVEDWHRWLALSGDWRATGRAVTGACTLAFLVLTLTGPILWWPRQWSRAHLGPITWFQRRLRGRARDFNWHNAIGIWSALPLAVIAVTGVVISYEWANALLFRMAGDVAPARPAGGPPAEARAGRGRDARPEPTSLEGLDALWTRAQGQVSGWRSIALRLPVPTQGPVTFTVDRGTGTRPDLRGQLVLDRKSGEVVRWEPFEAQTRGRQWRGWARWSHTGEVGGLIGQTVAGLASAGAVVLAWTGLALSWGRFRAWLARRAAARAERPLASDARATLGDNA